MSDTDLRALERETQRAPDDASAWLARAQGAARVGARDEALDAFYRSAALGGALPAVREGLRALRAPPTPWGHEFGDSRRSRCSPLKGPRRGEIVARAPLPKESSVVIAEDGTILVGQSGGTVARFDGRTLAPLRSVPIDGTWAKVWPSAGAGLVVATTNGTDSSLYVLEGAPAETLKPRFIEMTGPTRELATPVLEGERALVLAVADAATISVHTLDAHFERTRRFDAGSYPIDAAADAERIVLCDASGRNYASLNVLSWSGAIRSATPLEFAPREAPVIDALGRILVVTAAGSSGDGSLHHLDALDEKGRTAWRATFLSHEEGFVRAAATPEGGTWLVTESELLRIETDGHVAWSDDAQTRGRSAIVDREGCFFGTVFEDWRRNTGALVAVAPDRTELFRLQTSKHYRPVAIDAWGRLLAVHDGATPALGELVAIA